MSSMVKCDKCGKLLYTDCRSEKGSYCKVEITYTDGFHIMHLCKKCYIEFLVDFLKELTEDEFYDEYGGC